MKNSTGLKSHKNVCIGKSEKFGMVIGKLENIFASEFDEWKNCHNGMREFSSFF